jgi:hypothetical protein
MGLFHIEWYSSVERARDVSVATATQPHFAGFAENMTSLE